MGCLFAIFSLVTPRLVIVFLWVFGNYLATAYGSWFWPTAGFLFMPTTTIAYAVAKNDLSTDAGAITAAGVVAIVIGVLLDVGLLGGSSRGRRRAA
jgi:hypothetical protein